MQHTPNTAYSTVSSSETSCFSTTLDDPVSMTSQRSKRRENNLNLSVKSREAQLVFTVSEIKRWGRRRYDEGDKERDRGVRG